MQKEAQARIKINKMLEETGWQFFDDENGRANTTFKARKTNNRIKKTEYKNHN